MTIYITIYKYVVLFVVVLVLQQLLEDISGIMSIVEQQKGQFSFVNGLPRL